jgi:type IV secretion system protein TrbL
MHIDLQFASIFGFGASSLADAFLRAVTKWVSSGAADVVAGAGAALESTTTVPVNSGFMTVFDELRLLGAPLAAMFAGLAVIRAVIRQDPSELGKLILVRLPVALIGSAIALELVVLGLQATDSLSQALIGSAGTATATFTKSLAAELVASGAGPTSGFEVFVLSVICGFVAFCLWVELVIRASAIAIAALFIPLALAGAAWPVTASWGRRLGEVLAALILSKLVMAGVFALAINEIGTPSGLTGLIQGAALLLLATFAPWALLHLVPAVETGTIAQLEGLGGRMTRASAMGAGDVADHVGGGAAAFSPPLEPQLPMAETTPTDTSDFRAYLAHFEATLPPSGGASPSQASEAGTRQPAAGAGAENADALQ